MSGGDREHRMRQYFVGLDSGGSKTLGVLMDQDGAILSSGRAEGAAIVGQPSPRSCGVLASMKQRLCADAGIAAEAVSGIGLGLSGIDFADEFPMQHAALAACLGVPVSQLSLVNDGIVALWGASPAKASAIVHHGSGFTNAYRAGFGQERLFDHLDVGRIFDIRYALTALVARMIDGRAEPTPLREAALRHYGVSGEAYAEALYRERIPGERIRGGAAVVYDAWLREDAAAARLVARAADDYAATACTLVVRTGDERCEVAFGGGVINHAPAAFIALLADRVRAVHPSAGVMRPQLSPAHGAAMMAAFHRGLDPQALYAKLLSESLPSKG